MKKAFWISSTFASKGGTSRAEFIFATNEAGSVQELVRAIQDKGIVYGERLTLTAEDDGTRTIRTRRPCGLAAGGIALVQAFDHPIFEVDQRARPAGKWRWTRHD